VARLRYDKGGLRVFVAVLSHKGFAAIDTCDQVVFKSVDAIIDQSYLDYCIVSNAFGLVAVFEFWEGCSNKIGEFIDACEPILPTKEIVSKTIAQETRSISINSLFPRRIVGFVGSVRACHRCQRWVCPSLSTDIRFNFDSPFVS
jgi:hypothetical protein